MILSLTSTFLKSISVFFIELKLTNEIFNVGSGRVYSINILVDLLGGPKKFIAKRPVETVSAYANITKIRKKLKWKPKIDFDEGMKRIISSSDNWKTNFNK